MDRTKPQPLGWASTVSFVQHFAEEQAGRGAPGLAWRRRRPVQPQPAHAAFVGVAWRAGTGEVAMLLLTADVRAAITEAGKVFHVVTVTLAFLDPPHAVKSTSANTTFNGAQLDGSAW